MHSSYITFLSQPSPVVFTRASWVQRAVQVIKGGLTSPPNCRHLSVFDFDACEQRSMNAMESTTTYATPQMQRMYTRRQPALGNMEPQSPARSRKYADDSSLLMSPSLSPIEEMRALPGAKLQVYDGGWGIDWEQPSSRHNAGRPEMVSVKDWSHSDEVRQKQAKHVAKRRCMCVCVCVCMHVYVSHFYVQYVCIWRGKQICIGICRARQIHTISYLKYCHVVFLFPDMCVVSCTSTKAL